MSNATLSNLMLLQLAIEALLVLLLLVIWRRTRAAGRSDGDPTRMPDNLRNSIEKFLAESEKIAATFAQNLKDKKNISTDLILKLDRRLSDYQALLKQTETSFNTAQKRLAELKSSQAAQARPPAGAPASAAEGKANPAAPEVRALVLQMAKKGHSPEEIAAKARLHIGEIELIIDLERQFTV